jgi:hypothetical protein
MAAVRGPDGAAHTETSFGEVQAIADGTSYPVEGHPSDPGWIDTALEDAVFEETADFVIGEGGADGCAQAEAASEAAGDVVFSPALPGAERAGAADAAFSRVEAEHDFAERYEVIAAFLRGAYIKGGHG